MTTWAEVEEAVATAVMFELADCQDELRFMLDAEDYLAVARAAIKAMQELRLTAVVPDE